MVAVRGVIEHVTETGYEGHWTGGHWGWITPSLYRVSAVMNGGRSDREPTRNSKSVAVGVTTMTSCAVEAF